MVGMTNLELDQQLAKAMGIKVVVVKSGVRAKTLFMPPKEGTEKYELLHPSTDDTWMREMMEQYKIDVVWTEPRNGASEWRAVGYVNYPVSDKTCSGYDPDLRRAVALCVLNILEANHDQP